jgi:hypothetical protein
MKESYFHPKIRGWKLTASVLSPLIKSRSPSSLPLTSWPKKKEKITSSPIHIIAEYPLPIHMVTKTSLVTSSPHHMYLKIFFITSFPQPRVHLLG